MVTGELLRVAKFVGDPEALAFTGKWRDELELPSVGRTKKSDRSRYLVRGQYEDARKCYYHWYKFFAFESYRNRDFIVWARHFPFSNGILVV